MHVTIPQLDPYLDVLRALPFVREARFTPSHHDQDIDGFIDVTTEQGTIHLPAEEKRGTLNQGIVDRAAARFAAASHGAGILLAPHVTASMARYAAERGVNFIDSAGNCHIAIGGRYLAHVEGRRPPEPTERGREVRAAGYQTIFVLLARRRLESLNVRQIAECAGVGKTVVADLLRRLSAEGFVVKSGTRRDAVHRLVSAPRLLDRWLVGYADVLRPRLLVGRFEMPERDPFALEHRVEERIPAGVRWGWGGAAAAFRLTKHFRGDQTVLHVDEPPVDIGRRLGALPSREGRLTILRVPGPLALDGAVPRTVHPLLVYGELMASGAEREREAAITVLQQHLPWLR